MAGVRVEFAPGAVRGVGAGLADLGARRVVVVTDRGVRAAGLLDPVLEALAAAGLGAVLVDDVEPNPSTGCLDRAAALVRGSGGPQPPDAVLALGGGSVLDAAKGIALLATGPYTAGDLAAGTGAAAGVPIRGLPVVAVPTTAGTGAETNGFAVIEDRESRRKVYLGDDSVRPAYVVLDPELTLGVPAPVTAATGMDALVHGIESLASLGAGAESAADAVQAVALVGGALEAAVADGSDLEARSALLLGAHLAGRALTRSGLGLVHGIAHALTARTGAAHGRALSAVLVEVMEASMPAAEQAYAAAGRALGDRSADDAVAAAAAVDRCRELGDRTGARTDLAVLGLDPADVDGVAAVALSDPVSRNHPCALTPDEVASLLRGRLTR